MNLAKVAVRKASILLLAASSGCFVDPVAGVSRPPVLPSASGSGKLSTPRHRTSHALARVVKLARHGRYQQALRLLSRDARRGDHRFAKQRRWLRHRIRYLQQRAWFGGLSVLPEIRAASAATLSRTSVSAGARQFQRTVLTHDQGISGFGLRLWQRGDVRISSHHSSYLFRGVGMSMQAFAGSADVWPNTKLTAGMTIASDDSRTCPCHPGGEFDLFAGGAYHSGPLASSLLVGWMADPTARQDLNCQRSDLWSRFTLRWVSFEWVMPQWETTTSVRWQDRPSAELSWSLAPGLRLFPDSSKRYVFTVSARQRVVQGKGFTVLGSGVELGFQVFPF